MNVWDYEIGTGVDGWGNQELQYYTDRPENIKVEDGKLIITAKQESFEGSGYSSARILTKPSVVRFTLARPFAMNGNLPTLIS